VLHYDNPLRVCQSYLNWDLNGSKKIIASESLLYVTLIVITIASSSLLLLFSITNQILLQQSMAQTAESSLLVGMTPIQKGNSNNENSSLKPFDISSPV
jgi:hypothetical protein